MIRSRLAKGRSIELGFSVGRRSTRIGIAAREDMDYGSYSGLGGELLWRGPFAALPKKHHL